MLDLLFTELPLQLYELRYCKQYESSSRSMTRIVKQLENRQINGLYDSRSPTPIRSTYSCTGPRTGSCRYIHYQIWHDKSTLPAAAASRGSGGCHGMMQHRTAPNSTAPAQAGPGSTGRGGARRGAAGAATRWKAHSRRGRRGRECLLNGAKEGVTGQTSWSGKQSKTCPDVSSVKRG